MSHPKSSVEGCQRVAHAGSFCRLHYSEWFLENRAQVCTVPGCTCKVIARGLCATHHQFARRHGGWEEESAGQNGNRNLNGYDERFTGLFLNELELRGSPR